MKWRSAATPEAQGDLDSLLQDSMAVAGRALRSALGFAPFMLVVDNAGRRNHRQLVRGAGENPRDGLTRRRDRDTLRARATVVDVVARAPFSGDAIRISLEHRTGIAIDLLVPYSMSRGAVRIDLDRADAAEAADCLWPRSS